MTPLRSYLVFFRSGPNSLHPKILAEDPSRNWDCIVNWWGAEPDCAGAELVLPGGLNKTDGFHELARQDLIPWRKYRYILLLDDDVYFAPGDISRLFRICDERSTYLVQPALRWGTNVNHVVTLRNPCCLLRATSFVEVMAPVFSCAALEELLDTFTLTKSTWGIDWAWSSRLAGRRLIQVVDAVAVDHTKPVNVESGAFYAMLRALGSEPRAEFADIRQRLPQFGGIRTLVDGHTFAAVIPGWIGTRLVVLMDKLIFRAHSRGWL